MKKIAILHPGNESSYNNRLLSGLNSLGNLEGLQYEILFYKDLFIDLPNNNESISIKINEKDLKDFDLVYFRKWLGKERELTSVVYEYLKYHNVKFIDNIAKIGASSNKILQSIKFQLNEINTPKSLYIPTAKLKQSFEIIQEKVSTPFVVKDANGSLGKNNFLVSNKEDLEKLELDSTKSYIIQEYIPHDSDYRIIVYRGEAKIVRERVKTNPSIHQANTSMGAKAVLHNINGIDEEIKKLAEKAAIVIDRIIAGVDVIKSKENGQYYLIEVNSSPSTSTNMNNPDIKELHDLIKKYL